MKVRRNALILSTLVLLALLAWSGWHPYDRPTWFLEVTPILVALPVLWATWQRFPLTTLLYGCIFLHAIVLMVGGAYTYARVPLGFALQDWMHLERNPYDRIGHFFQGFVPALAAREILLRGKFINGKGMLAFLVICVVMTVSVTYEFIEWATALLFGQGAQEFLGTQGDPWDTQWDMFMALIGAVTALLLLSRYHDRQIARLK
jgi:putative membrane protein